MRIVAFDISIRNLGIAITDNLNYVFSTTIRTESIETSKRLLHIYEKCEEIIDKYKPNIALLESIFYHKNAKTLILLSSVKGVIQLLLQKKNIQIFEISPTSIKLSITGFGFAKKHQVQYMTKVIFKLNKNLNEHESDALALIWTFFNKHDLGIKR
ncbi:MAG: crossover junction endodeoxyribonuclease RuvC [candidate division WOR-3 bacterium]|jgi:crossover junction endodeoxyribonuclease RuvC